MGGMPDEPKYYSRFDGWLVEKFQPFAKLWFELIRTAFVVALFNYVAVKSGSSNRRADLGAVVYGQSVMVTPA